MKKSAPKENRFKARNPAELKKTLSTAAALQGRSLSDFAIFAAAEDARRTIEDHRGILLCEEDQIAMAMDIAAPEREINPRLRAAWARYVEKL